LLAFCAPAGVAANAARQEIAAAPANRRAVREVIKLRMYSSSP
jgi:hypothetical protein